MENKTLNNDYAAFMDKKAQLAEIIDKSTETISRLDMQNTAQNLRNMAAKVESDTFKIQIVGSFSNGKSSLINSLLGGEYLPAYALPCTAIINEIKYAEEKKAVLHFMNPLPATIPEGISKKALAHMQKYKMENVPPMDIPYDEIEDYTCIPIGADINQIFLESPYQKIELFWPLDLLKNGVEIIDTPGLDDVATRTKITTDYLTKADVILFLMTADHLCGKEEMKFLENNLKEGGFEDIFFLVNKFDLIAQREQERMKQYARQRLSDFTSFQEDGIYFVSALNALEGKMQADDALYKKSGMDKFERDLSDFLVKDRGRVKLAQPARELKRVLYNEALEKTIPQQKNMLSMSLDEVKRKYSMIKPEIDKLTQRKEQMEQMLGIKIENAMHDIKRCVNKFYIGMNDKIPVWIEEYEPTAKPGFIPTEKNMQPVIAELSEYINKKIEEEQHVWSSEEFAPIVGDKAESVFGSVEADLSKMLDDIDRIKVDMSGQNVSTKSDVPVWQRIAGAAGGILIGDLGVAISGGLNGIGKDMIRTVAFEAGAGFLLGFIGLLNPVTLVGIVIVSAFWSTGKSEDRTLKTLKKAFSDSVLKQLDENREKQTEDMLTGISEKFKAIEQTIITALDNEISEENHQLDAIMEEMGKGQTEVDTKLAVISDCEKQLKTLYNETDNFYFDLINGI